MSAVPTPLPVRLDWLRPYEAIGVSSHGAESPTRPPPGGRVAVRSIAPAALCGFLLLLVVVFAASYAVGTSVGPVAPGMHRTGTTQDGSGGGHDGGGMEMDGMGTDHGSGR
ncbi:hypothetical protein ACFQ10_50005 [Streptomyces indonesiensis]